MLKEITGAVFRIATIQETFLVEIDEKEFLPDLAAYCAKLAVKGYHITCVSRIYKDNGTTPRIAVLSTPAYRAAIHDLMQGGAN